MKKKMIFILMGPPGVGKGTISQIMSADYPRVRHVSLGSYFRYYSTLNNELGKKIKDLIEQGLVTKKSLVINSNIVCCTL